MTNPITNTLPQVRESWDAEYQRHQEELRLELLLAKSLDGDGEATLAHPKARQAFYDHIRHNKSGISNYANRKASKLAKEKLIAREQRRAGRKVSESAMRADRGRISRQVQPRLHAFAVAVAESYHNNIANLYTSKRARIEYGRGGVEEWDNDAYSKSYGYGARYQLAGARIVDGHIVLENNRGTEKARIPLPAKRHEITFDGLLDGDIWGRKIKNLGGIAVIARYKWLRKKISWSGFTAFLTVPQELQAEWPTKVQKNGTYAEHGNTICEIKAEYRAKERLATNRLIQQQQSAKVQRLTRLISRLCGNLVVTHDDRKAVGFCNTGTKAFLERFGLAGREQVTVAELRSTGSAQVERPIMYAAEKVAIQLIRKGEQ